MESEPDQRRRPMGCAGIAAIGIVLLYVLSIGPAFRMLNLSYLSESTIEVAYAPLIWLSDHSEIGDEALRVYLDIWAEYGTYPMWKGKRVARKYYPAAVARDFSADCPHPPKLSTFTPPSRPSNKDLRQKEAVWRMN